MSFNRNVVLVAMVVGACSSGDSGPFVRLEASDEAACIARLSEAIAQPTVCVTETTSPRGAPAVGLAGLQPGSEVVIGCTGAEVSFAIESDGRSFRIGLNPSLTTLDTESGSACGDIEAVAPDGETIRTTIDG